MHCVEFQCTMNAITLETSYVIISPVASVPKLLHSKNLIKFQYLHFNDTLFNVHTLCYFFVKGHFPDNYVTQLSTNTIILQWYFTWFGRCRLSYSISDWNKFPCRNIAPQTVNWRCFWTFGPNKTLYWMRNLRSFIQSSSDQRFRPYGLYCWYLSV